jgi:hypothetical protein
MVFKGHIKNGTIVLDESAPLPEGAEVRVEVVEAGAEPSSLRDFLLSIAGKAEGLPPDASTNLDHYLYGLPKVKE